MTINPGSEQKQNCPATNLKCAKIKSCLRDHPLNELWSRDQGQQETVAPTRVLVPAEWEL